MAKVPDATCSIERTLGVLGGRWTFLILREAFLGAARFVEFRDRLGVAPDVLTDRLATLVEYGVLERSPTGSPAAPRFAYRLKRPDASCRWCWPPSSSGATSTSPARGPEHAAPGCRDRRPPCTSATSIPTAGRSPRRLRDDPDLRAACRKRPVAEPISAEGRHLW